MGFRKSKAATDPPADGELERDANDSPDVRDSNEPSEDPRPAGSDDAVAVLDAAKAEASQHYDRFLRARAELDNVQKRHARELEDRARYAVEPLAVDLLPVVDDLERAKAYADEQGGSVAEGVDLLLKNMLDVLAKHGVERIAAAGVAFDPAVHEAVAMIESAEVPAGTVLQEHRAGYTLKGKLLRPAMVVVAKSPMESREPGADA